MYYFNKFYYFYIVFQKRIWKLWKNNPIIERVGKIRKIKIAGRGGEEGKNAKGVIGEERKIVKRVIGKESKNSKRVIGERIISKASELKIRSKLNITRV